DRARREIGLPRPSVPLRRDALPLTRRRARFRPRRAGDLGVDRRWHGDGPAPPDARRGGCPVPSRVDHDEAGQGAPRELPLPGGRARASRGAGVLKPFLEKVVEGRSLSEEEAAAAMRALIAGEASESQAGAYLTALRVKG